MTASTQMEDREELSPELQTMEFTDGTPLFHCRKRLEN